MDRLRSMQYFIRAVELGSLSAAARDQGTTQPTVSKALAALEQELGVRLLERSTTGLSLTDQGQRFYARARQVVEEFNDAVSDAQGRTGQATGLLRLNAPVALGQLHLTALVHEFLARYPDIEIELILNDRFVDLVEEGVDVALRLGGELPPNAVARRIGVSPRLLVAAPGYLDKHDLPRHPLDLARHNYVRFAWLPSGDEVELHNAGARVSVKTKGRFRVNNALSIREALAMGAGIGLCPAWLVDDLLKGGQLVHVLPEWTGGAQELFLMYPSRRYQPLRAKLFIDFVSSRVPAWEGFDRGSELNGDMALIYGVGGLD